MFEVTDTPSTAVRSFDPFGLADQSCVLVFADDRMASRAIPVVLPAWR